jgi:hypothetical protein
MRRRAWHVAVLVVGMGLLAPLPAVAQDGGIDLSSLQLPPGFLDLSNLELSGPRPGVIVATATTTLMGNVTNALVSSFVPTGGGKRGILLALKPTDWSLTRTFPALANPVLDQLTFQYVALVVTDQDLNLPSASLSREERAFFRDVYQSDDFTLRLTPGINLIAAIPAEGLPPDHPLVTIMNALGIEKGVILLQGTLGKSLTLLTNPASAGLSALKDLYLRAELPPMRPQGSPAWFNSGQLALELTGLPSVRLVGDINVTISDDLLDFFLAATLAKTGVSLSGGLHSDSGWSQPFGIQWMVLNDLVLSLGITPTGSIQPGFAGSMVIGKKDIDVAIAVAISPAGVPTNFIFDGESKAGFGLSDLIELQQRMRAARDAAAAATGASTPAGNATIPLDALPDIDFKDVKLKFAPKDSPDLGVTRGMAIKGEMWLAPPGGDPSDVAGVDINVGNDGLWARGHLAAFTAGPLTWDDADLDLTLTPSDQHLLLNGQVQLFGARQQVDLTFTRQEMRFHTESELYDLFHATLDAQADLNLRQPSFRVDGVAESDFADAIQPILRDGIANFADDAEQIVATADAALGKIDQALSVAEATATDLRTALEAQRATAEQALQTAQAAAASARSSAAAALSQRNSAYRSWRATPTRRVALKAQRRATYIRWRAIYATRAARYAARAAAVRAAQQVLDAIPPVDQNVVLQRANAAAQQLRDQLTQAQTQLTVLRDRYQQLNTMLQQGGVPLAIDRAEVHADLAAMLRGEAVRWKITGTFLDAPFTVEQTLNFGDPSAAVAQLLSALLQR